MRSRAEDGRVASDDKRLEEWVLRCRRGDLDAFGHIVRSYHPSVRRMCLYMTRSEADADDAAQDTFLRAFRAIGRFRGEARFTTWLFRICVNACRDQQKRTARDARALSASEPEVERAVARLASTEPGPRALAGREELRRLVREAVQRLPESHRRVVVLVALEGLSHSEAARVLRLRTATVTWYMQESRARLRAILGPKLDGWKE